MVGTDDPTCLYWPWTIIYPDAELPDQSQCCPLIGFILSCGLSTVDHVTVTSKCYKTTILGSLSLPSGSPPTWEQRENVCGVPPCAEKETCICWPIWFGSQQHFCLGLQRSHTLKHNVKVVVFVQEPGDFFMWFDAEFSQRLPLSQTWTNTAFQKYSSVLICVHKCIPHMRAVIEWFQCAVSRLWGALSVCSLKQWCFLVCVPKGVRQAGGSELVAWKYTCLLWSVVGWVINSFHPGIQKA